MAEQIERGKGKSVTLPRPQPSVGGRGSQTNNSTTRQWTKRRERKEQSDNVALKNTESGRGKREFGHHCMCVFKFVGLMGASH